MKNVWKVSLIVGLAVPIVSSCGNTAEEARASDRTEAIAKKEEARRRGEVVARVRATLEDRIHFAFDRADISSDAQRTLRAKMGLLKSDETIRLRIEGHADERGTEAYNQRLALRRAEAAKRFLVRAGISPTRLEVMSFGETMPLERGRNQRAWAANRRTEYRILSGPMPAKN